MAERRMFAKTIIDSDAFLDMSVTARLLYYDLSMRADDDGFVNSPKKIMRMIGAAEDDLRMLAARKFIIPFDNGVVVIKHWHIHNYIRKDRYNETQYSEQKAMLDFDENGAYRMPQNEVVDQMATSGLPSDNKRLTQVRLGKVRLGKDNKPSANAVVYFHDYPEVEAAFQDFIKMRKSIKAPLTTERAISGCLRDLKKHAEVCGKFDAQRAVEVIEQSIKSNWKTFYELKQEQRPAAKTKFGDFEQHDIDFAELEKRIRAN